MIQRHFPKFWDNMVIDVILVCISGRLPNTWFGIILIPKIDPHTKWHIRSQFFAGGKRFLNQFIQFILTLSPGFCQDIFCNGVTVLLVGYNNTPLPAPIFPLSDCSRSIFSSACHYLFLLHDLTKKISNDICGLLSHVFGHMGISIQRKGGVCVPQYPSQGLRIDSACQGMCSECVTQIVETDRRQSRLLEQSFHLMIGSRGCHWRFRTNRIRKNPLTIRSKSSHNILFSY